MPKFEDHIEQAKRNLLFLSEINAQVTDCHDWQVTCVFYTAVHFVNAHLSKHGLQYRTHVEVADMLNPCKRLSISKVSEDVYVAYRALQSLSRRSRYLVNGKDKNLSTDKTFLIYEKHLAKSLRHLDKIISYFHDLYKFDVEKHKINCVGIKPNELCYVLL